MATAGNQRAKAGCASEGGNDLALFFTILAGNPIPLTKYLLVSARRYWRVVVAEDKMQIIDFK
ncbi:hypothetical protein BSR04_02140 [Serratia plymuthica]|nr:hypothetical protein BSR04_02140 [Serratia plymuthica]